MDKKYLYVEKLENCLEEIRGIEFNENGIDSEEYTLAYNNVVRLQNEIARAGQSFKESLEIPEIKKISQGDIVFSIEEQDCIFHAILDQLIEKRYRLNDARDNLAAYFETINYWHNSYWISLMKGNVEPRNLGSVLIIFVHHYKKKNQIKDLDNFEYKNFIDTVLVQGGFIKDDNPNCLKTIYTSLVEETTGESYTEVYWGKPSDISKYLKSGGIRL